VHSRLRSWLAIIDIVIRIVAVVAIVSIGEGTQQNVESRLGGFGADIITITTGAERASKVVTRRALGGLRSTTTSTNAENLTKKDIQVLGLLTVLR
jgi:putative ABC transport system permease protein